MTRPKVKKPLYPLVAFRLPEELIEQLDAITAQLTRERPGMKASRSSTIRVLLEAAIKTKAWKLPAPPRLDFSKPKERSNDGTHG